MGKKPKEIVNPVLKPENRIYYTIFHGVSPLRRLDKLQRIATIDIIELCRYYGMCHIEIEEIIFVISQLDKKAIENEAKRQKELCQ